MCNLEKDVFVLLHSLSSVKSFLFFFFTMWDIFKREQMSSKRRKTCLEAKKFSNSRRYTPVWPTATFWQIEATFFSNQMIFAAGALSFRRPCHRKKKKKRVWKRRQAGEEGARLIYWASPVHPGGPLGAHQPYRVQPGRLIGCFHTRIMV